MDYDTINLFGLQPTDVQNLSITRENDLIIISITLTQKIEVCPICGSLHSHVEDLNVLIVVKHLLNLTLFLLVNKEFLMLPFSLSSKIVKGLIILSLRLLKKIIYLLPLLSISSINMLI